MYNANEIDVNLNIDEIFSQKRIIQRKIQFDGNLNTPSTKLSVEEHLRVNYFLYLVDQTIVSFRKRFEHYRV